MRKACLSRVSLIFLLVEKINSYRLCQTYHIYFNEACTNKLHHPRRSEAMREKGRENKFFNMRSLFLANLAKQGETVV